MDIHWLQKLPQCPLQWHHIECEYERMRVWENASMRECEYERMRVWENASMRECEYERMRVWENASMRECEYERMRVWENASMRNYNISSLQWWDNVTLHGIIASYDDITGGVLPIIIPIFRSPWDGSWCPPGCAWRPVVTPPGQSTISSAHAVPSGSERRRHSEEDYMYMYIYT